MLEQWEIDLRKQLGDVTQAKPKNWEEELAEDVGLKPEKSISLRSVLVVAILSAALVCLILFVLRYKTAIGQFMEKPIEKIEKIEKIIEKPDPMKQLEGNCLNLSNKINSLENNQKKLEETIAGLNNGNNKLRDKVNVMGILFNENFVILRDSRNKQDLLFLGSDWTIPRSPKYIQMSDSDKAYLDQFVKPRN